MSSISKIIRYEVNDVVRSKWLIVYGLFFFLITDSLFRFGGSGAKVVVSLINVVLILIPLVSIIFGTMYLYHAREFVELLLSHPIDRRVLFAGMYAGLALPLALAFLLGTGIPFAIHGLGDAALQGDLTMLLLAGIFLTFTFVGLAFLISVLHDDKVKGLGLAIFAWLFFAVVYDGLVLFIVFLFGDYPLENPMIALSIFNPIDLARILLLLKLDVALLMGYTGAVFQRFFGSSMGQTIALLALITWTLVPFLLGSRSFRKKDFS